MNREIRRCMRGADHPLSAHAIPMSANDALCIADAVHALFDDESVREGGAGSGAVLGTWRKRERRMSVRALTTLGVV